MTGDEDFHRTCVDYMLTSHKKWGSFTDKARLNMIRAGLAERWDIRLAGRSPQWTPASIPGGDR